MSLIDYSNTSVYNISALKDVQSFSDIFLTVDKVFGVNYLFGSVSLIILFISILMMYKDYDIKVGLLTSSLITLIVSLGYYFAGLIAWQHLLISFCMLVIVILFSFRWVDE